MRFEFNQQDADMLVDIVEILADEYETCELNDASITKRALKQDILMLISKIHQYHKTLSETDASYLMDVLDTVSKEKK